MIHVWQARGLRKNPVVKSEAGANDLSTLKNRGDSKAMINIRACLWLVLALTVPSFALAQEAPDADEVQEAIADETDSLEAVRELEGEGDEVESPARLGSVTVTATRRETELNKTAIAVTPSELSHSATSVPSRS